MESVYATEYEIFDDVAADLPDFIDNIYNARRLHSALGCLSRIQSEERSAIAHQKRQLDRVSPRGLLQAEPADVEELE